MSCDPHHPRGHIHANPSHRSGSRLTGTRAPVDRRRVPGRMPGNGIAGPRQNEAGYKPAERGARERAQDVGVDALAGYAAGLGLHGWTVPAAGWDWRLGFGVRDGRCSMRGRGEATVVGAKHRQGTHTYGGVTGDASPSPLREYGAGNPSARRGNRGRGNTPPKLSPMTMALRAVHCPYAADVRRERGERALSLLHGNELPVYAGRSRLQAGWHRLMGLGQWELGDHWSIRRAH